MLRWAEHLKGGGPGGKDHAVVATWNELYAFGGYGMKNALIDVYVFNTVSLHWTKLLHMMRGERRLDVPTVHYGHTAVLIDDTVYIWGGFPYCNVLYAFDVNTHGWFRPRVSGSVPEERYDHSACVLGKVMFIHGGLTQAIGRYNDMCLKYSYSIGIHKWDTSTMAWSLINTRGTPPPASFGLSSTIVGTKMFVFEHYCWTRNYIPIRVFDTETNHWLSPPSVQQHPEEFKGFSAFTYNGELYVWGGDIVWKFNPETFSWRQVGPKWKQGPNHRRCCCVVGDRVFLFGGYKLVKNDVSSADLHVLDFSPSLKTLCKLAAIQYGLDRSELPHNIRWELAAMTSNRK